MASATLALGRLRMTSAGRTCRMLSEVRVWLMASASPWGRVGSDENLFAGGGDLEHEVEVEGLVGG